MFIEIDNRLINLSKVLSIELDRFPSQDAKPFRVTLDVDSSGENDFVFRFFTEDEAVALFSRIRELLISCR